MCVYGYLCIWYAGTCYFSQFTLIIYLITFLGGKEKEKERENIYMDGRRSRGRGRGRGNKRAQEPREERETTAAQEQGPRVEPGDQMATAIQQMTNILTRLVDQQGQILVNQPPNPEIGEDRALERFQKFAPPKFLGGSDPDVVEQWLEAMINIFAALNYTEQRQVNFAVFQFEGPARAWWNVIRAKWEREQTVWTWANFIREFNEKYRPPLVQERREDEFIGLRQGTLSVAEYETKFTKLSKFASELVATEPRRVRRFIQGLNLDIQEVLAAAQVNTFTEALGKAQRIENAKAQVKASQTRKRGAAGSMSEEPSESITPSKVQKVNFLSHPPWTRGPSDERSTKGSQVGHGEIFQKSQQVASSLTCGYCGKANHIESDCWRRGRKCLICGSGDHQVSNCPRKQSRENSTQQLEGTKSKQANERGNRTKVPARVYALDNQQTHEPSEGKNFEDEIS
ncbi:uncharacterized protein [Coffea arabica]|uniref:CCHC-type domain-containing protein n=1 Tax=Coffea arabica TaxID=13443 RepID=A0ABM4WBB1_COFAR